jgi:DNA repair protein REV1
LATKRAKPNGQFRILPSELESFLGELSLSDLPGVGWQKTRHLGDKGLVTERDALGRSKEQLQVL